MLGWIFLVLTGLVAVFYLLSGNSDLANQLSGGEIGYLIVGGALVAVYLLSLVGDYRGRARDAIRHVVIWLGLGFACIAGYAYRGELQSFTSRIASEVLPPGQAIVVDASESGDTAVRIRRLPNGHFAARGTVNGTQLQMLVDTGASTVVLKFADAERIGIDTSALSFTVAVSTANGTTYAAPIRLKSVSVGPLELTDVDALVAKAGNLSESLLGMSFLKRLRSYEFSGDFLTLRG